MFIALLFPALFPLGAQPAQWPVSDPSPASLQLFLEDFIHFTPREYASLKQGKIVTKLLDTSVEREVAVFGVMWLEVPLSLYLANLKDHRLLIETATALEYGEFRNPPQVADLAGLSLAPGDLEAIRECRIGDCDIKLSAQAIERIHREVDWSQPSSREQVEQLLRQMMVEYVQAYLEGGNSAMATYYDKEEPLRLVEEFHDLLRESPYLYSYQPDFHAYLEQYPRVKLAGVEDFIYWAKEDIGARRQVISLNHMIIYRPPRRKIADALFAAKQLYASHYLEASFGITALAEDPEDSQNGFYLIYLNRSRIDVLRHPRFGFIKGRIKKGVLKLLTKKMGLVKERVTALK